MTAGVTGASGFLGASLAAAFLRDGIDVVALVREPAGYRSVPGCVARPYELGTVPDLDGLDLIVHCAFAARGSVAGDGVAQNVDGTTALFAAARRRGIPFVFISSINADAAIESAYARQKCAIEARLGDEALVLRPGLIAGDGGLFATLRKLAQRPWVPLVGGGRNVVQLVAVEDVYAALRVGVAASLRGAHNVVASPALTLREVIARLNGRAGGPRFIDVPLPLAFALASFAERIGVPLPVTTENLRGLRGSAVRAPSERLRALGWEPESAAAVLERFAAKVPS